MSQASVCQCRSKPCEQEQGGDMVAENIDNPEIGDLKKGDSDKISKLKKEVEGLLEEKNEAIFTINSKNKEIKALEAQVKKLEAEKIVFETRPQESKLLNLTKEVAELREAKGNLEAEIKLLKDQIKKLKAEKDDLQKQLNDLVNKHSVLKQEVGELDGNNLVLEEKVDHLEAHVGNLKNENKYLKEDVGALKCEIEQLKSDDKGPLLLLGELCFQIPSLIYQNVIPQWHNNSLSYNLKDMEEDITELGEESQILAQKTWTKLKKELNWKGKYARELKKVRDSRNTTAHPAIDEKVLYKAANEAKENGNLDDYTYNNIVELIGMWKKLNNIK